MTTTERDEQPRFSTETLRQIDVDSIGVSSERPGSLSHYRTALNEPDQDAARSAADLAARSFLAQITALHLRWRSDQSPYEPASSVKNLRTSEVRVAAEWMTEVSDPALKARVADVVYLHLRRPEYAETAVDAYLEAAARFEDRRRWTVGADALSRALSICARLKQKPKLMDRVASAINDVRSRCSAVGDLSLSAALLDALVERRVGEPAWQARQAEQLALAAGEDLQWNLAEKAWGIGRRAAARSKAVQLRRDMDVGLAEMYAAQARHSPSGMGATHFMRQAIEQYRRAGNSRSKTQALHAELTDMQGEVLNEMGLIRMPVPDLSDAAAQARQRVAGRPFREAMTALALEVEEPPDHEELRERAEAAVDRSPFAMIASTSIVDGAGRQTGSVPSILEGGTDSRADQVAFMMARFVGLHHFVSVEGSIEPARASILAEHEGDEERMCALVCGSAFVRPGHETIVAKGLQAGVEGDWIVALHLLLPQYESCLRFVLEQCGEQSTRLTPEQSEEQLGLPALLGHPVIRQVLGDDVVLDLRMLLVERLYTNLRHRVSHAMMSAEAFSQCAASYVWWLSLRLYLNPEIAAQIRDRARSSSIGPTPS